MGSYFYLCKYKCSIVLSISICRTSYCLQVKCIYRRSRCRPLQTPQTSLTKKRVALLIEDHASATCEPRWLPDNTVSSFFTSSLFNYQTAVTTWAEAVPAALYTFNHQRLEKHVWLLSTAVLPHAKKLLETQQKTSIDYTIVTSFYQPSLKKSDKSAKQPKLSIRFAIKQIPPQNKCKSTSSSALLISLGATQTGSFLSCSGNEHLGNTGFPRGEIF